MEIKCKADLENVVLRIGDVVDFEGFKHEIVKRTEGEEDTLYLHLIGQYPRNIMFGKIGVDPYDFAEKHYGYHPEGVVFPETKPNDFPALTRLVVAIYEKLEAKTKPLAKAGDYVVLKTVNHKVKLSGRIPCEAVYRLSRDIRGPFEFYVELDFKESGTNSYMGPDIDFRQATEGEKAAYIRNEGPIRLDDIKKQDQPIKITIESQNGSVEFTYADGNVTVKK